MLQKVLLIDDEEDALENLRELITHFCPQITIVATASTTTEAYRLIQLHKPDFLFLDIHLNGESGFDLLEKFPERTFGVIFTTAHMDYALKAIKHSAVDYLLKPIDVKELQTAISLAIEKSRTHSPKKILSNDAHERIVLTHRGQQVVKKLTEILYCEADSNYTIFHFTEGEKIVTSKTLKEYQQLFQTGFLRVHAKYLVNSAEISSICTAKDLIALKNGKYIPVSRRKKTEVINLLRKHV